jgi:hypothetical protein
MADRVRKKQDHVDGSQSAQLAPVGIDASSNDNTAIVLNYEIPRF